MLGKENLRKKSLLKCITGADILLLNYEGAKPDFMLAYGVAKKEMSWVGYGEMTQDKGSQG